MVKLDTIITGINMKDTRSWEQLYSSCYAALCTYVESIINDIDTSKDIVQELLVNVWRSEVHFRNSKELLGYLYKSLYNRSMDFIRKQRVRERVLAAMERETMDDSYDDFLLRSVREEIIRQLYLYIGDLPPDRRKIVELSISGFSGKEIADKLGISINTVKVQKNRSIKYLRDRLINAKERFEI
jgi:RNA polymerase sigma factor, sigma-70 family